MTKMSGLNNLNEINLNHLNYFYSGKTAAGSARTSFTLKRGII
jgi:hypothetical protein